MLLFEFYSIRLGFTAYLFYLKVLCFKQKCAVVWFYFEAVMPFPFTACAQDTNNGKMHLKKNAENRLCFRLWGLKYFLIYKVTQFSDSMIWFCELYML